MSLRDLNPATRRKLRRHAWLLTIWCVAVGLATSWLLLHGFGLRRPAARFGIAAVAMYSLGLVVGARIWLVHFSQAAQGERELGLASPHDAATFESPSRASKPIDRVAKGFDWADLLGNVASVGLDEGAALLVIPAIVIGVIALFVATGGGPLMLLDSLAGLLAEVALQFVFGALIARRVMRPSSHDAAFMTIVGKTWLAGIAFLALSVVGGLLLEWFNPGGASLADLFR